MNFEKLDRVKSLVSTSNKLGGLIGKYAEKAPNPRIDKHDLKFDNNERFAVFRASVSLNAHYGEYGSSSCYVLDDIPNKDAEEFLLLALNKNMGLILEDMASFAKQKAASLKNHAKAEIDKAVEMLDSLSDDAK